MVSLRLKKSCYQRVTKTWSQPLARANFLGQKCCYLSSAWGETSNKFLAQICPHLSGERAFPVRWGASRLLDWWRPGWLGYQGGQGWYFHHTSSTLLMYQVLGGWRLGWLGQGLRFHLALALAFPRHLHNRPYESSWWWGDQGGWLGWFCMFQSCSHCFTDFRTVFVFSLGRFFPMLLWD